MTSAAPHPLVAALHSFVGARIDGAHANPDTGLIALSLYAGEKHWLGLGIGPHAVGVGWLPHAPRLRASASHPLVAALRAHIVDHRVRDVSVDDEGTLWIVAGGEGAVARLAVRPGKKGEALVYSAEGRMVLRFPSEPAGGAAGVVHDEARDLATVGAAMLAQSERLAIERARASLLRAVRTRAAAMERRAEAVRKDLARLGDVTRLQKVGRLLLAQGAKVPRGAKSATLQDWEEGGTIEVTLDPAVPAKTQAETFFAKARRYQRGEVAMRKRLDEAERAHATLAALADEVSSGEATVDALAALGVRARSLGVSEAPVAVPGAGGQGEAKKSGRKPFVMYRSANGRPILVGRGGKDNDALTAHHARPHDLWLHAKDVLGAHVIVPLEKGTSCPPELLVDAATLAAHHSDARGEAVCDVSYVEKRYVRKPRGSAPGAVKYDHEKIIAVRIEPARLERLMASREEPG